MEHIYIASNRINGDIFSASIKKENIIQDLKEQDYCFSKSLGYWVYRPFKDDENCFDGYNIKKIELI